MDAGQERPASHDIKSFVASMSRKVRAVQEPRKVRAVQGRAECPERVREPLSELATSALMFGSATIGCALLGAHGMAVIVGSPKMRTIESSLTPPRVVRGAESLGAGYALVGLQPTD
jgi:hypothetical protein